jgi:hypothetical protein
VVANADYDTILATTLSNYVPQLEDNVFTARPLVFFLKEADQVRLISGGDAIVIPLIYKQNDTVGFYEGYDTIPTTPQGGISAAKYDWKQAAVSISIAGIEEAMNNSEEEVIDLLESKVMQAEETLYEFFDEWLIKHPAVNAKAFHDLEFLLGENSNPVGGIDPTTPGNEFWQSNVHDTAEVLTHARLTNTYNTASVGADRPNAGLTDQTLFEKYESMLQAHQMFSDPKTADAGFQNLLFKATPVTYDDYVTAGDWFWLNTKYLRLTGHRDVWFKPTQFIRPPNQDARYAQILTYGNFTISNRKKHHLLRNKTA